MKLKYEFVAREIMGEYVLVPAGDSALKFGGMITTSDIGAFLINLLTNDVTEAELVGKLMDEYEVDKETAVADVNEFLSKLKELGIIE